jgi:predicted lipoprotein with Yx(FWY)xxD motif
MRVHTLLAGVALGAIALTACGSGSGYSSGAGAAPPPSSAPTAARMATATTGSSALGPVLVDADGRTLYGSAADMNGVPSCVAACASVWPPVIVDGTTLPAGLDAKLFSIVARPDGSHQLEAGKWPLYRYSGDAKAGETNGQGLDGFFVATPTGALNKSA